MARLLLALAAQAHLSHAVVAGACDEGGAACSGDDGSAMLQVAKGQRQGFGNDKTLLVIDMQNDFVTGTLPVSGAADIVGPVNELTALPFDTVAYTMDYHPANHISFAVNNPDGVGPFENVVLNYTADGKVCGEAYVKLYGASAKVCDRSEVKVAFNQTLWPAHCIQETHGAELVAGLEVKPGAVFVKKGFTSVSDSYGAFETNFMLNDKLLDASSSPNFDESDLSAWLRLRGTKKVYICGLALDYCVKNTALQARRLGFDVFLVTDATKPVTPETGDVATQLLADAGVEFVTVAQVKASLAALR